MGHTNEAHVAAGSGCADCLLHRFLRAYCLNGGMRTVAIGQFFDSSDAFPTTFFHDVGSAELAGKCLTVGVTRHGDDAVRTHLFRSQNAHETDRAVTHHSDGLTGYNRSGIGSKPPGPQDIGSSEQALCLLFGGLAWNLDQGAIGKRNACLFGLGANATHHDLMDTA